MFDTGRRDLVASRWTPFVHEILFDSFDFTGADFTVQIRDRKDGGTLRVDLAVVGAANTEGIYINSAGPSGTTVTLFIDETTMEAIDAANEPGDDASIFWGMHITPSGGVKFEALSGTFTVKAEANNA